MGADSKAAPVDWFALVTRQQVTDDAVEVDLTLPADLLYFQGHFPGQPILPGVAQIHLAETLGRTLLPIQGAFAEAVGLKFRRPLVPGDAVTLSLRWEAGAGALRFTLRCQGEAASSGKLLYRA